MKSIFIEFFLFSCLWLTMFGVVISACTSSRKNAEEESYIEISTWSDSLKTPKPYCFDQIQGKGRPSYSKFCTENTKGNQAIALPFDIGSDSVIFYFQKGNKYDTLNIKYNSNLSYNGESYTPHFSKVKIKKSTFDSTYIPCLQTDSFLCNDKVYRIRFYF